MKIKYFYL